MRNLIFLSERTEMPFYPKRYRNWHFFITNQPALSTKREYFSQQTVMIFSNITDIATKITFPKMELQKILSLFSFDNMAVNSILPEVKLKITPLFTMAQASTAKAINYQREIKNQWIISQPHGFAKYSTSINNVDVLGNEIDGNTDTYQFAIYIANKGTFLRMLEVTSLLFTERRTVWSGY